MCITYECERCGLRQTMQTPDGVFVYPGPCQGRCRGYKWTPLFDHSICEEVQQLQLQEHVDFFDASASDNTTTINNSSIDYNEYGTDDTIHSHIHSQRSSHNNNNNSSGGGGGGGGGGMNKVIDV